eukprot:5531481-Prymnesium_polylepis.1
MPGAASSRRTTSSCPSWAAMNRGVAPRSFARFTLRSARSNMGTGVSSYSADAKVASSNAGRRTRCLFAPAAFQRPRRGHSAKL